MWVVGGRQKGRGMVAILFLLFPDICPAMAYRVVRMRREARRSAKLEDIFQAIYG